MNFSQIKKIIHRLNVPHIIITDDHDAFVVMTLESYERMLGNNALALRNGHEKSPAIEDIESLNDVLMRSVSVEYSPETETALNQSSNNFETDFKKVNGQLDKNRSSLFSEIRYEHIEQNEIDEEQEPLGNDII